MSTQNIYALTDTWNAGGTTFTAIKMDVLDTASAAGSALLDLQVGGVSQFKVSKAGAVTAVGVAIPTISSTSTLTNKTLSSPTLSGTVAGNASWSGTQTFNADIIVGNGTSYKILTIKGSSTGPSDGTAIIGNNGGASVWAIGNYSVLFGGGYDPDMVFYNGVNDGKYYAIQSGVKYEIANTNNTITLSNKTLSGVTMADGTNIVLNTTTGTKIGTSTSQKLGFFNATPVVQPTAVADATGAGDVVAQLNALLSRMRNLGLIAT